MRHSFKSLLNSTLIFSGLMALLAVFSGCATQQLLDSPYPSSANPNQEIATLQTRLTLDAGDDDVDVLSKKNYFEAESALRGAKQLRNQGHSRGEILERLSDARAHLIYAENRARAARQILKDTRDARATAVGLDAGTYLMSELEKIDVKYLEMARSIEQGDEGISADDQAKLVGQYQNLTTKAVRMAYLPNAVQLINEAEEDGARERAPRTYSQVLKLLGELDQQINKDATDTSRIQLLSSQTSDTANLLIRLVQRSNEGENAAPEEALLQSEKSERAIQAPLLPTNLTPPFSQ